jgi:hypothetical protein
LPRFTCLSALAKSSLRTVTVIRALCIRISYSGRRRRQDSFGPFGDHCEKPRRIWSEQGDGLPCNDDGHYPSNQSVIISDCLYVNLGVRRWDTADLRQEFPAGGGFKTKSPGGAADSRQIWHTETHRSAALLQQRLK